MNGGLQVGRSVVRSPSGSLRLLRRADEVGDAVEQPVPHDRDVDAPVSADVPAVAHESVAGVTNDETVEDDGPPESPKHVPPPARGSFSFAFVW